MFCPRCGTKATTGEARFCYECGADMGAVRGRQEHEHGPAERAGEGMGEPRRDWRAWVGASPLGSPNLAMPYAIMKDHRSRTLLSAVGLMALLVLAVPLLAGVVLLGLFATAMLVGALFHLAPAILIGLLVYWVLKERGRLPGAGRHHQQYHQQYREV